MAGVSEVSDFLVTTIILAHDRIDPGHVPTRCGQDSSASPPLWQRAFVSSQVGTDSCKLAKRSERMPIMAWSIASERLSAMKGESGRHRLNVKESDKA